MKTFNSQFGEIEYSEEHVFEFPEGIIGFEHLHKFILINDVDAEPFRWLVSIQDEDVCFPILDPKFVDPLYEVNNHFENGMTVAVIACLKEQITQSTVNLRSPLVFNRTKRTAKQTILETERYSIQQNFIAEPQLVAGE